LDSILNGLKKSVKNHRIFNVKEVFESINRKWVKMAFENLNIGVITFHRVIFVPNPLSQGNNLTTFTFFLVLLVNLI